MGNDDDTDGSHLHAPDYRERESVKDSSHALGTVLVVGGCGWLGSAILDILLRQQDMIHVMDIAPLPPRLQRFVISKGNEPARFVIKRKRRRGKTTTTTTEIEKSEGASDSLEPRTVAAPPATSDRTTPPLPPLPPSSTSASSSSLLSSSLSSSSSSSSPPPPKGRKYGRLMHYRVDLTQSHDVKSLLFSLRPTTIIHVASLVDVRPIRDPRVWEVNVEGTGNLVVAAAAAGVRAFVFCSTLDVW